MNDPEIRVLHVTGQLDSPDDHSWPWLVHVNLKPPEFMQVAFIMRHGGSEEAIARCSTREAVDRFIDRDNLRKHPRLRWIRIKGPDGKVEELKP